MLADVSEPAIAGIYVERVGSVLHLYEVSHIGSRLCKFIVIFDAMVSNLILPVILQFKCRIK